MKILLRDHDEAMATAWATHFAGVDDVEVSCGDVFGVDADAIVSPANSFGFMDGGVDRVYLDRLGWDLQDRLQQLLRERHDGELPVGQAVVLETLCPSPRYLVSAPTMRLPGPVPQTLHAYLAFRAALQAVRALDAARPGAVGSLVCPGMATARGQMPVDRSARQMRAAYDNVVRGVQPGADAGGVNRILRQHMLMLR